MRFSVSMTSPHTTAPLVPSLSVLIGVILPRMLLPYSGRTEERRICGVKKEPSRISISVTASSAWRSRMVSAISSSSLKKSAAFCSFSRLICLLALSMTCLYSSLLVSISKVPVYLTRTSMSNSCLIRSRSKPSKFLASSSALPPLCISITNRSPSSLTSALLSVPLMLGVSRRTAA